jgi:hypothetical protein
MKRYDAPKEIVYKFDGFRDLANYAITKYDKEDGSSNNKDSDNWAMTKTLDHATKLMVDGWSDVLPKITAIRDQVRQRIGDLELTQLKYDSSVYGSRMDVSSFCVGSPLAFLRPHEDTETRKTRFVRILVDTSFSASVDPQDIVVRGSAVVALCDTLNACGYSTEVWATSNIRSDRDRVLSVMLPVQSVGEPWDVASAMFPLAHPSFLRRLVFAVMESMSPSDRNEFGARQHRGYGYVVASTKDSQADRHCGGADIICQTNSGSIEQITRNPVAWVLSQCSNLGVISQEELV